MNHEVAITGVGAVTPLGSAGMLLDRWCAGERGAEGGVGVCREFEPRDYLSDADTRRTDRFVQLAVGAAEEALQAAGWLGGVPYEPYRVACVIGSAIGGEDTFEADLRRYRDAGPDATSRYTVPRVMTNAGASAVAIRHGLQGPSVAVASAGASGADAVAAGARLIRTGEADAVVAGGSESALSEFVQTTFRALGEASPTGVCRPFDVRRDGWVLSEGAGVLVLENGDLARSRRAPILGRIAGIGSTSDGYHRPLSGEVCTAGSAAIAAALSDAELVPEDVDYVNANGTGTAHNDRAETEAVKASLGAWARHVPVSSVKSAIGHSLGAAGAIEAVVTLLALLAGIAPPTLNFEEREEGLDLDYVQGGPHALPDEPTGSRYGLTNSRGLGGHNTVLVIESAATAAG